MLFFFYYLCVSLNSKSTPHQHNLRNCGNDNICQQIVFLQIIKMKLSSTKTTFGEFTFHNQPHRWCNGWHALLNYGRTWVQALIKLDYKVDICCFSAKHTALRRKSKNGLARNQENVSEWGNMSICGLLLQWASTIKLQLSVLVLYKADLCIISLKITCSCHDIAEKLLSCIKEQSLTHSYIS